MRYVRSLLVPILVLGLLTAGVGVAYAHEVKADSEITKFRYNDDKERFLGKVESERPACVRNRTVRVKEQLANGERRLVGEDETNDRGRFKVADNNPKGDFFAKVLRKVHERGDHRHVCRKDRSDTITVDNKPNDNKPNDNKPNKP